MLEDGLEDVENLYTDLKDDVIAASYVKMAQSVSFSDLCAYTIELPVSEHWRPKVKATKQIEIKNLQDYETFEESKMKDKKHWVADGSLQRNRSKMDRSRYAMQD